MDLLPEDVTADILRRLPAHSLAAARCVHSSWRAAIDARRLMHLAPLPLAGIFINFCDHYFSELFVRPTPQGSPTVSGKLHRYMPITGCPNQVDDNCNGLLLIACAYVVNPATRRWATLPSPPPFRLFGSQRFREYEYIVFDPAVSPHYEVVIVHHLPSEGAIVDLHMEGLEWPPSPMVLPVYSSATNRWEERPFTRHGEALGTVAEVRAPWPGDDQQYGVYWCRHLYVHHNFIMRISLVSGKYKVIKLPHNINASEWPELRLGKSENGVYLASIASAKKLQVWILDESCAHAKWVLKHQVDLIHVLARRNYDPEAHGSWVMEDVNYHLYSDRFPDYNGLVLPENRFEWDSDNDDVLDTKDKVEGPYNKGFGILGFHPHKEVIFLSETMRRGLAYHLNTSKLQDLGNIYPTRYECFADTHELLLFSFPYTPCWTVEFPSNN
ncbi:unnamed protein product [Alopecurus aequalis]